MSFLNQILVNKKFRIMLVVGILAALAALLLAWKLGLTPAKLKSLWIETEAYLKQHSWAMFLALVLLPGLPVPLSALLILAGIVWGANLHACLWMLLALALNMTWTYWVAAYPARGLIEKLLAHTAFRIPELPRNDHMRLILLLRLTPGLPIFIHNYILGFFRTPFLLYLPLSMLLSGAIACGILLTGGALLSGQAGAAITGISLIVVGAVAVKILRARLAKKSGGKEAALTDPPAALDDEADNDPAAEI